ncbi:hypothetical protein EOL73_00070 [Candidatus Saccharibacteria bacterium]|nr:hypothetical protein [Candidatus Saccharibacteria bacterium]
MKKSLLILFALITSNVFAYTLVLGGAENAAVTHSPTKIDFGGTAKTIYVYNSGTSTVFCAFGSSFAEGEEGNYPPIKAGSSITLNDAQLAQMTFATATGQTTTIDYGFVGD